MFRLRGTPLLLNAAVLSLALGGCSQHMIYREMYSPRKNYFVPPVEKAPVLPPEKKPPGPPVPLPPPVDANGLPPAVPPALPGMETPPPAVPPAM